MGQCITKPVVSAATVVDLPLKSRSKREKVEEPAPKPAEELSTEKVEEIKEDAPVASGKESDRSLKRLFDKDELQQEALEENEGQLKRIPEEQEEQEERALEDEQVKIVAETVAAAPEESEKPEAGLSTAPSTEAAQEASQESEDAQRGSAIEERPETAEVLESKSEPSNEAAAVVVAGEVAAAAEEGEPGLSDDLKPGHSAAQKVPDLVTQDSEKFELIVKQVSEKFEIPGVPEAPAAQAQVDESPGNEPEDKVNHEHAEELQKVKRMEKAFAIPIMKRGLCLHLQEQEGIAKTADIIAQPEPNAAEDVKQEETSQGNVVATGPDAADGIVETQATAEASVEPPEVESHTRGDVKAEVEQANDQGDATQAKQATQDGDQAKMDKARWALRVMG